MAKTISSLQASTPIPGAVSSPTRVADRAESAIEALIAARGLQPGARLPAERALAAELAVSRASVREALGRLAARGRVMIRRGGIVVAEPPLPTTAWARQAIADPLAARVAADAGYGQDVLEIRRALDGCAAYYAALRADDADRAKIRACFEAMAQPPTPPDALAEARLDAAFHLAIAEASHNVILQQVMSSLFGLLQRSISQSLETLYQVPRTADALLQQHRALMDAVLAGDAEGARAASDQHLQFVETTIREIEADRARRARAATPRP